MATTAGRTYGIHKGKKSVDRRSNTAAHMEAKARRTIPKTESKVDTGVKAVTVGSLLAVMKGRGRTS